MTVKPDNLDRSYSAQLSEFDSKLRNREDHESTLTDLNAAIKRLLIVKRDSESDIRAILHKRLQDGQIRDRTFELVLGMLDSVVSEDVPTIPDAVPVAASEPAPVSGIAIAPASTASEPISVVDGEVQVGSVLRDRFQLVEHVASGGMGVVYKACDRRLEEAGGLEPWVAIKVLNSKLADNPVAVRALQQEAAKGRCLSHPNIVRFIDIDRHDDLYFIVMEWLEGRSLATILDNGKGKQIDHQMMMDIVSQTGQALDYAHRCGVVHADIKPANVMITPSGQVKLIDFGIARVRQQQASGDPAFDPGELGSATPAYSSMQVLTGETPVPADDVFSLGCLMYRLAAGYRVFGPRNAAEAAEAGMSPQPPQSLAEVQWRALKKSLAYARVSRFPSVRAFLEALSQAPAISVSPDDTLSTIPALPNRTRRGYFMVALLVAVLAAGGTQTDFVPRAQEFVAGLLETAKGVADDRIVVSPAPEEGLQEAPNELQQPTTVATAAIKDSGTHLANLSAFQDDSAAQAGLDEAGEGFDIPDFSALPPATVVVPLASVGRKSPVVALTMVEDGREAIVDLVRDGGASQPLIVEIDEIGFTGNRSPLHSGQYQLAGNGEVRFAPGQTRARTTISMVSDPLREADRQVTLLLRESDNIDSELAVIELRLEDDDQRVFEAGLPTNTVAFAVSRVSVRESDPAAQIDIIRFNPSDSSLQVGYQIRGITAEAGQDYFEPRSNTISFAPTQRSARILVPLVQDNESERDEAFMLELIVDAANTESDIFRRMTVMIRDDDSSGL